MSKERALRRAEREAQQRIKRARAARRRSRREGWRRLAAPVRSVALPRRRRPGSLLVAQRRRQDGVLIAFLLALHVALWLATDSWWWRVAALLLTVLLWPLLVTMVFDRRRS